MLASKCRKEGTMRLNKSGIDHAQKVPPVPFEAHGFAFDQDPAGRYTKIGRQ